MSGHIYSRKKYDSCYFEDDIYISKYEGDYRTNPIQTSAPKCGLNVTTPRGGDSFFNPMNKTKPEDLIDLESHLRNIDSYEFCDNTDPNEIRKKTMMLNSKIDYSFTDCQPNLNTGFERLQKSKLDYKSPTWNGLPFPLERNEDSVFFGFGKPSEYGDDNYGDNRFGMSTRLVYKDVKPYKQDELLKVRN